MGWSFPRLQRGALPLVMKMIKSWFFSQPWPMAAIENTSDSWVYPKCKGERTAESMFTTRSSRNALALAVSQSS